ncbi:MAG: hypothetical protein IKV30_00395 [Clostridia bacterium]|nr:hypothetical protein [Clostridia bacterium]
MSDNAKKILLYLLLGVVCAIIYIALTNIVKALICILAGIAAGYGIGMAIKKCKNKQT